uniref:Uncharacterized protein n=1 Tax=viral metagenome TaxID=1070528 RepID=A0A6M3M250_9ZZZZ
MAYFTLKKFKKMKYTDGYTVNGQDDHWTVNCPDCGKEFEYTGYFDSGDKTECPCGCVFTTTKIEFEDGSYII